MLSYHVVALTISPDLKNEKDDLVQQRGSADTIKTIKIQQSAHLKKPCEGFKSFFSDSDDKMAENMLSRAIR
ncbi:unnamed protein product [Thlaspi arvense]|uniref:Uncharacterized protein n=1 Tax=Thlaspi arvense TaxID=13288 RepID=A0AAU9SG50_THLAR|nr:unnamed protein product [Thlaspi arvense]